MYKRAVSIGGYVLCAVAFFLSGCSTSPDIRFHTTELVVNLDSINNGKFMYRHYPIGTKEEGAEKREDARGRLLYDLKLVDEPRDGRTVSGLGIYTKHYEGPYHLASHRLAGVEGGVAVEVRGEYYTIDALEELLAEYAIVLEGDRFVRVMEPVEEKAFAGGVVRVLEKNGENLSYMWANGSLVDGVEGERLLVWSAFAEKVHISYTDEEERGKWRGRYSLLPELERYLEDPDRFKKRYVKRHLERGYAALEKKELSVATTNFEKVLAADEYNELARHELRKINEKLKN